MRSDYTQNGRHKDDPTNPQSHWNDWTIDRDGNKLNDDELRKVDVSKEIEDINNDFKKLALRVNVAMLTVDTEQEKSKLLSGLLKNLIEIVEKQDKVIQKLIKN